MGIFSRTPGKGELVALFDVGSSSVAGALVYLRKDNVPHVIFSVREPIALSKNFEFNSFLEATLKSLEVVALKVGKSGLGAPKRLFFTLSSPWYGSESRVIRFEKKDTFTFTSKFADELIEKEVALFRAENSEKYANFHSRMLPVELKNMKTILNGYPSANPINQRAEELEMTIFISMSAEEFMTRVQDVAIRHFHREEIKFSSFSFVSFAVTRDFFAKESSFLLVDVGGELTDISLVKQEVLASSVSFPKGINFMVREISQFMNCSSAEARSMLTLFKEGHAGEEIQKKLGPLIDKLKSDWLEGLQVALAGLSHDISVPSLIFVTIEPEFAEFFGSLIKMEQFSQYTLSEAKFEVSFLGTEELHGRAVLEKDTARDPFIILESIYINRFLR